MKKNVVKIGGSLLSNYSSLKKILKFLKLYENPIVVVSAFSGITDLLIEITKNLEQGNNNLNNLVLQIENKHLNILKHFQIQEDNKLKLFIALHERLSEFRKLIEGVCLLNELTVSAKNKIVSFGERLSSFIVTEYLIYNGIDTVEKLPEHIQLTADKLSEFAKIDIVASKNKVYNNLLCNKTTVVPGFYCLSPCNKVSLLGRGGSDYSATAIANMVDAKSVDFWKDCKGFRTADPNIISTAAQINCLSYKEAAELAYFGAKIFHPSTVEPLKEKRIPLNLFNPDSFTKLTKPLTRVSEEESIHNNIVKSVTFTEDIGVIKLVSSDIGAIPGILADFSKLLCKSGINIKSVITSQTSINFLISLKNLETAFKLIKREGKRKVRNICTQTNLALIAVVGTGITEKAGIAYKLFGAVSKIGINVLIISAGASDTAVYFIVNKTDKNKAVSAIHKEFFV
jgi:aspartate kinase/aspartokinase/homoserine dehydrogenase 1